MAAGEAPFALAFGLRAAAVVAAATLLVVLWDEGSPATAMVFAALLWVPFVPLWFLDGRDRVTQWIALLAAVAGIALTIETDRSIDASDSSTAALGWIALLFMLFLLAGAAAVVAAAIAAARRRRQR